MKTYAQFQPLLHQLLADSGARSVLLAGEAAGLLAESDTLDLHHVSNAELLAGAWQQRADLAIALLRTEPAAQASALIAALRDLHARRLLLFLPPQAFEWKREDMVARGLSLLANYELQGEAWQAWSFDILSYKPVPDWLNPRFWANPELWGKYRW